MSGHLILHPFRMQFVIRLGTGGLRSPATLCDPFGIRAGLNSSICSTVEWEQAGSLKERTMKLGNLDIAIVSGGRFWIDGGGMFGVVPRPLWERVFPPDDKHRIPQETNCLLVRDGERNILIDTGYGSKLTDKQRRNFSVE